MDDSIRLPKTESKSGTSEVVTRLLGNGPIRQRRRRRPHSQTSSLACPVDLPCLVPVVPDIRCVHKANPSRSLPVAVALAPIVITHTAFAEQQPLGLFIHLVESRETLEVPLLSQGAP